MESKLSSTTTTVTVSSSDHNGDCSNDYTELPPSSLCRRRLIVAPVFPQFDASCDESLNVNRPLVPSSPFDVPTARNDTLSSRLEDHGGPEENTRSGVPMRGSRKERVDSENSETCRRQVIVPFSPFSSTPMGTPGSTWSEEEGVIRRAAHALCDEYTTSMSFNGSVDETSAGIMKSEETRTGGDLDDTLQRVQPLLEDETDTEEETERIEDPLIRRRHRVTNAININIKQKLHCKVIVIGPSGAGKSTFIRQYIGRSNYKGEPPSTVGIDCYGSKIDYSKDVQIQLDLWDIMGQDDYYKSGLTHPFYNRSHAAILMFDITSRISFLRAIDWKRHLDSLYSLPDESPIPCLLLANKCDLQRERTVGQTEIEATARDTQFLGWIEVSSRNNLMLNESIRLILDDFVRRSLHASDKHDDTTIIKLSSTTVISRTRDEIINTACCCIT